MVNFGGVRIFSNLLLQCAWLGLFPPSFPPGSGSRCRLLEYAIVYSLPGQFRLPPPPHSGFAEVNLLPSRLSGTWLGGDAGAGARCSPLCGVWPSPTNQSEVPQTAPVFDWKRCMPLHF